MHEKIREDPLPEKKEREAPEEKQRWKAVKLTYDERKNKLKARRIWNVHCSMLYNTALVFVVHNITQTGGEAQVPVRTAAEHAPPCFWLATTARVVVLGPGVEQDIVIRG